MKNRFVVCFIVLVLCFLASGSPAAEPDVYSSSGTLINFEETRDGWEITLLINREQESGLVADNCRYYVNNREVSQGTFVEMGMGEQVTVEFHGDANDVALCRAYVSQN